MFEIFVGGGNEMWRELRIEGAKRDSLKFEV